MKNLFRLFFVLVSFIIFAFTWGQSKLFSVNLAAKNRPIIFQAEKGRDVKPNAQPTLAFEGLKKINDTEIFCKVIGRGEPLVIVHGGPGLAHDYLYEPFKQLADKYQLIFYDQRGCGRSAEIQAEDSVTVADLVEDLEGVRQAFKINTMNLVGQSWGAIISINYLSQYPYQVKRLLLLEPAPGSTAYLADFQKTLTQRLSQSDKERLASLAQNPRLKSDPIIFQEFMNTRFKAYSLDTLVIKKMHTNYFDSLRVKKFFASSAAFSPYLMQFDLYDMMKKIDCSTLIIHGEFDPIPTAAIERMAASIKHSELHIIKGSGHFVHIEQPEVYFDLIRAFLAQKHRQ